MESYSSQPALLVLICFALHIHIDLFPGGSGSKESACSAGYPGFIPGSGRSPGEGNGYLLQYSCLENSNGQRSLASHSRWGHRESDMTEQLSTAEHSTHLSSAQLSTCLEAKQWHHYYMLYGYTWKYDLLCIFEVFCLLLVLLIFCIVFLSLFH